MKGWYLLYKKKRTQRMVVYVWMYTLEKKVADTHVFSPVFKSRLKVAAVK